MYIYIYICVCVSIYICMCTCIYTHIHAATNKHTHTHTHARTHTNTYVRTHSTRIHTCDVARAHSSNIRRQYLDHAFKPFPPLPIRQRGPRSSRTFTCTKTFGSRPWILATQDGFAWSRQLHRRLVRPGPFLTDGGFPEF